MGLIEDFDDRHIQAQAEGDEYHPYDYQTENNTSWAGALPVKQYVFLPCSLCAVRCEVGKL
jgi:glutamate synthase (NADPH/NADH)